MKRILNLGYNCSQSVLKSGWKWKSGSSTSALTKKLLELYVKKEILDAELKRYYKLKSSYYEKLSEYEEAIVRGEDMSPPQEPEMPDKEKYKEFIKDLHEYFKERIAEKKKMNEDIVNTKMMMDHLQEMIQKIKDSD